jgi:hypothetical protein
MTGGEEHAEGALKPWDEEALDMLRFHWGDAYEIEVSGGRWRARRRDGIGGWSDAADPDGLGWAIAADYAAKPVPRDAEAGR